MEVKFASCRDLNKLDISSFDMKNVSNMDDIFIGYSFLKEIKIDENIKIIDELFNKIGDNITDEIKNK